MKQPVKRIKLITKKVVKSGDLLELYVYKRPLARLSFRNSKTMDRRSIKKNKIPTFQSQVFNFYRQRKSIKRLIACNFDENSKFVTLTFEENLQDLVVAKKYFHLFIKRLRRYVKKPFKYLSVVEFQSRGAIHYHVVMDIDYLPAWKLAEIWDGGFVRINKVNDKEHLVNYITKYLSKGIDSRLFGFRKYTCSKGLIKPEIQYDYYEFFENNPLEKVFCSDASFLLLTCNPFYEFDFSSTFDKAFPLDYYVVNNLSSLSDESISKVR